MAYTDHGSMVLESLMSENLGVGTLYVGKLKIQEICKAGNYEVQKFRFNSPGTPQESSERNLQGTIVR